MSLRLPKSLGEVLERPTWPGTLERELARRRIGVDYDTDWTRRRPARALRRGFQDGVAAPLTKLVARPEVLGLEHLDAARGAVIFAANHTSHLDTGIVLSALPPSVRRQTVVAAAADYFFDRPWKATLSALLLGAIPVERTRVNRQSADIAAALIEEGWNLVIFPEGGRSTDGWGQEFRGGAAYLAKRCGVPVVPIHLRGVRPIFPKGSGRLRPGHVEVRLGAPLRPARSDGGREEDARRFAARIEGAVAALADEAESDWWSARRRFYAGETPPFRGPEGADWRRSWALPESSRSTTARRRGSWRPW